MPRTPPTTNWTRDRFSFPIIDVSGFTLQDFGGEDVYGMSDTNSITTTWS